jgi:hypothetical protein
MRSNMTRLRRLCLLLTLPLLLLAQAQAASPDATPGPARAVDAFHAALAAGDRSAVLSLLAGDVLIFEQGFATDGRNAYAKQNLKPDITFAQATHYKVLSRRLIWLGNAAALVLSQSRTTGTFDGHQIDLVGTETMLVRRYGNLWQIAHIHWSAHSASKSGGS